MNLRSMSKYVIIVMMAAAMAGLSFGQAMAAATGSLTLATTTPVVHMGETISVEVREDSGSTLVNAVQAKVGYPASKLAVTKIDTSGSAFDIKADERDGGGTVYIARGKSGATLSGSQLVAVITFTTKGSGWSALSFRSGTAVVGATDNKAVEADFGSLTVDADTLCTNPSPAATSPSPSPSPADTPAPTTTPKPASTPSPTSAGAVKGSSTGTGSATPATLPVTGAGTLGGVVGFGSIAYAGRAWARSRKGLKTAMRTPR